MKARIIFVILSSLLSFSAIAKETVTVLAGHTSSNASYELVENDDGIFLRIATAGYIEKNDGDTYKGERVATIILRRKFAELMTGSEITSKDGVISITVEANMRATVTIEDGYALLNLGNAQILK